MSTLFVDFETASELDLGVVGLDNYLQHPSTRVLLLAWAIDEAKVQLWEPREGAMPAALVEGLDDPLIMKCAWNSAFERGVFRVLLRRVLPTIEWLDPMIQARYLSMPGYLEDVGRILRLREDEAKLEEGKRLLKMFCEPVNEPGAETLFGAEAAVFRDWQTDPEDWDKFREYCRQDVVSERAILKKLLKFPLPDSERQLYALDQVINERGMPVDMSLVRGGAAVATSAKAELRAWLKEQTQLENPNSNAQMLEWVRGQGYPFNAIGKSFVERALKGEGELTPLCREVLKVRKQAAKTSDSKFEAIANIISPDGRLRHQFAFYGATRTGRWAGKEVQLQNFPRPVKAVEKKLVQAIELLRTGDLAAVKKEFTFPMDVVASCMRSVFQAPPGFKFVVCDLNAIENRKLGWLAECDSILQVFRDDRCPYLSFGAIMYKKPYEELYKAYKAKDAAASEIRQNSKPAVLGAGYRLGGGEEVFDCCMQKTAEGHAAWCQTQDGDVIYTGLWGYAKAMGVEITRDFSHDSVKVFRDSYPEVVQAWYDLENAAMAAIRSGEPQEACRCRFEALGTKRDTKLLRIVLPSGRALHYIRPKIERLTLPWGKKDGITYEGLNQKTRVWTRITTHGGKLMENVDQASSRDVLAEGMRNATAAGFTIVGHVHDEIICLEPVDSPLGLKDLRAAMIQPPAWAPDLPLGADGYEGEYYRKG